MINYNYPRSQGRMELHGLQDKFPALFDLLERAYQTGELVSVTDPLGAGYRGWRVVVWSTGPLYWWPIYRGPFHNPICWRAVLEYREPDLGEMLL